MARILTEIKWSAIGLEPLRPVDRSSTGTVTRWEVRYKCCGKRVEMTRKNLRVRMSNNASKCIQCALVDNLAKGAEANKNKHHKALTIERDGPETHYEICVDRIGLSLKRLAKYWRCEVVCKLPGSKAIAACKLVSRDLIADYGVTPPEWPVPRASLIGAHVPWVDRCGAG